MGCLLTPQLLAMQLQPQDIVTIGTDRLFINSLSLPLPADLCNAAAARGHRHRRHPWPDVFQLVCFSAGRHTFLLQNFAMQLQPKDIVTECTNGLSDYI